MLFILMDENNLKNKLTNMCYYYYYYYIIEDVY